MSRIVFLRGAGVRSLGEIVVGRRLWLSASTSRYALIALLGAAASSSFTLSASAKTINVSNEAQLDSAIASAARGDTIALTSNIALTSALPAVTKDLTIDSGSFTLSGGQLVKSGPNVLALVGNNTFEGALITGSILRFTTGEANLGAADSDIVIKGGFVGSADNITRNTTIDRSLVLLGAGGIDVPGNPIIWSGPISGSGQFIKSGNGELTLTGVNNYRGGTNIIGGRLAVDSDAELGRSGTGVIIDRGTLRALDTFESSRPITLIGAPSSIFVDDGKLLTLDGPISGGELRKQGAGVLALNGSNSYSEVTIVGGQLRGDSHSISGNVFTFSSTSVLFDQTTAGTFGGVIDGVGSLIKDGSGLLTLSGKNEYLGGTFVFLGTLQGTSNSLRRNIVNNSRLIFNQDFDGTFGGNISDAAATGTLIKTGVGNLTITGTNQTSITNINGGTLTVNGSLTSPNIFVNDSGTLAGSENVVGRVDVRGGGDIAPSNPAGALHILGEMEMEPQSEYRVQINGVSSDEIEVTGAAKIESSTFEIEHDNTSASPVVPGKTYTILTTTGGLTVEEPTVAIADFPFINFALSEDGFNGYLTTSRSVERFAELASTPNEAAVANALDTATSSLAWQQVVGASTAEARAAFSSLSNASIHASAAGVLSEQSHFLRDAVLDRLRQDFPTNDTPASANSVLSYAGDAPTAPAVAALPTKKAPDFAPPLGPVYAVWAQGLGGWGSLGGNGNVARTNDSIGGIISGIDVTFNRMFRLGFAGGYSQSNFNSVNIPASGSADSYHFALYGGWQNGPWALRGGGSVSWNDLNTSRQVTAVNLGGQQTSSYGDKTWQGFVEGARSFAFGPSAALEPFANVAYVHVGGDVSESGLAAMSGSTSFDTTYTTLGAHGSYILPAGLTAQATLGWRYAFGDVTPLSTLAFEQGGSAFALAGSPIARNALVTELGVNYAIGPTATIGIAYSGQYGGGANENSGKATFTLRF
jgi:outer membrane autotransporter protein